MAQTIWIHRLTDAKKAEANGMEYICEHLFQALTQTGKLTKKKGAVPECQREKTAPATGSYSAIRVERTTTKATSEWRKSPSWYKEAALGRA